LQVSRFAVQLRFRGPFQRPPARSVRFAVILIVLVEFPPVVLVLVELFEFVPGFDQVFELAGGYPVTFRSSPPAAPSPLLRSSM
jgi:hypothetical protein